MTTSGDKTPLEQLIELMVYAPVGLIYERDEVLDRLVTRGRSQVQLARLMAKMAAQRKGGPEAMVGEVIAQAADVVARGITEFGVAVGLAPDPRQRRTGSPDAATSEQASPESRPTRSGAERAVGVGAEPPGATRATTSAPMASASTAPAPTTPAAKKPAAKKKASKTAAKKKATATMAPVAATRAPSATPTVGSADGTESLPIAGYDGLTARDIIALVDDLTADQRSRVAAYEAANRNRKTVLAKIDRLGR